MVKLGSGFPAAAAAAAASIYEGICMLNLFNLCVAAPARVIIGSIGFIHAVLGSEEFCRDEGKEKRRACAADQRSLIN